MTAVYSTSGLERVMHLHLGARRPASVAEAHREVTRSMGVYYADKTMLDESLAHFFQRQAR